MNDDDPDFSDLGEEKPVKKKKKKATKIEKELINDQVLILLRKGTRDKDVIGFLVRSYQYSRSSAEAIISGQRAQLLKETASGRKDILQNEAYNRYMEIIESKPEIMTAPDNLDGSPGKPIIIPGADYRCKVLANEGIVRLLGLAAPTEIKIDQTVNDGKASEAMEQLRQLAIKDPEAREMLILLSEKLNGFVAPNKAMASLPSGGQNEKVMEKNSAND